MTMLTPGTTEYGRTQERIAAMNGPIRELVAKCRAMPRGKARNAAEERLGKMLKKQDALILKIVGPKER